MEEAAVLEALEKVSRVADKVRGDAARRRSCPAGAGSRGSRQ